MSKDTQIEMPQQQSLFSSEIQQSQAILGYILSVIALPETLLEDKQKVLKGYFLLGLPLTLPLSLMSAPIFFISRQVKIASQKVIQSISPDPNKTDEKKVLRYLKKGVTKQIEVSQQTWKQAMQKASQQYFLKQNKKIIVVNQLQKKHSKRQISNEKQFIFVVDQNVKIWQICQMIKNKLKSSTDSMYLTFNGSVLPGHIKVCDVTFNKFGIVKMAYASIETFG